MHILLFNYYASISLIEVISIFLDLALIFGVNVRRIILDNQKVSKFDGSMEDILFAIFRHFTKKPLSVDFPRNLLEQRKI